MMLAAWEENERAKQGVAKKPQVEPFAGAENATGGEEAPEDITAETHGVDSKEAATDAASESKAVSTTFIVTECQPPVYWRPQKVERVPRTHFSEEVSNSQQQH